MTSPPKNPHIQAVNVVMYKTTDGTMFKDPQKADERQNLLDDPTKRICPICGGKGKVTVHQSDEDYRHEWDEELTCVDCHGKGVQTLTTEWK